MARAKLGKSRSATIKRTPSNRTRIRGTSVRLILVCKKSQADRFSHNKFTNPAYLEEACQVSSKELLRYRQCL